DEVIHRNGTCKAVFALLHQSAIRHKALISEEGMVHHTARGKELGQMCWDDGLLANDAVPVFAKGDTEFKAALNGDRKVRCERPGGSDAGRGHRRYRRAGYPRGCRTAEDRAVVIHEG